MNDLATKTGWMLAAATVAVLGLAACTNSDEKVFRVGVDTTDPLFGAPVSVWIEGLEAGQSVSLAAHSEDETGLVFQSEAIFEADEDGVVDLGKHAPVSGDYEGVDGLGIFWSMKPQAESKMWRNFMFSNLPHIGVTLEAATADGATTSAEIRWHIQDPAADIVRVPVEDEGFYGVLWRPAGTGPFPTLILLGGSGGGIEEWWAKAMASHGYASLALAYFGHEDLPGELMEVPLESVERAIVWLNGQEAVDAGRLAVMGGSKGGELALLAAATYPEVRAVVGCVASGIIWQGVHEYEVASSWSLGGRALPYAKWFFPPEDAERLMAGETVALRNTYAIEKNDPETLDAATIPVEKINGPVLLVSGTDDQMWPSDIFGDLVMERLAANDHPHERRHLKVEEGGHLVFLPVFVTGGNRQPVPFMFGGTAEADAHGSVEFWEVMLDFLNRHLGTSG